MTIVLSSQTSLSAENVIGNAFGAFGDTLGIPGFPFSGNNNSASSDILSMQDKLNSVFNKLMGKKSESFEPSYMESGRQVAVGSGIEGGNGLVETAKVRVNYSQTPQASVIIKKKPFSSLQDLYNPNFMDPAERWFLRATKRLIARKCVTMSDYERLTKIERLVEAGASTSMILASLLSSAEENSDNTNFTSAVEFEKVLFARQPNRTTTYFVDTDMPILEELGEGNGVFEITAATSLSTSLDLDGNSSFSLSIEDPYRILFVTEDDIETAIKETAISGIVNQLNSAAGEALNNAQLTDAMLSQQRRDRGKSEISISVGLAAGSGVVAIIDAIGLQIDENNLGDVPEEQALNSSEQSLFTSVMANLKAYQTALNKNIMTGLGLFGQTEEVRKQMNYTRNKMRLFYLGKSIIQPMDTISIFIDGGTRRAGEGEEVENNDSFSFDGALNFAANALRNNMIEEDLLLNEWRRAGEYPDFETFKKLRTLSFSTENMTPVFTGLVKSVTDTFNAESGTYILSVSGESNMCWLDQSRYNQQPSLDQTQGILYDPLTPFDIELDKATGLPTGKVQLSAANQKLLQKGIFYFNSGPNKGQKFNSEKDMLQDILVMGGNLINLYQHAPGLVYKWKEGIMTATYNSYATNPLDGSLTNLSQLRRDVGFFASNTPFDNMDAANVLSILITGIPYNPATFIQSAVNTGAYNPDSTLNSGKDYFHSILNMQQTITKSTSGFVPFKSISIDPLDLARSIYYQRRISDKSNELMQLRNQEAKLSDQIANISKNLQDKALQNSLSSKLNQLSLKVNILATDLSLLSKGQNELSKNLITIAGNDVAFDFASITNNEEYKLFGDKLAFATLRRREDVVRNKDKNYFIVSDEYDKDYDIQAFILKLRDRAPGMWKSNWRDVKSLCREVAETLNFEFYCNSSGHLVFRPPQYNRTPRSVLEQMLLLNRMGGIKVFPDFLISLFQSKEQSLINEINVIEWKIRLNGALLGASNDDAISQLMYLKSGNGFIFLNKNNGMLETAIKYNQILSSLERQEARKLVRQANATTQLVYGTGLFSADAQRNLQDDITARTTGGAKDVGNKEAYETAVKNLAALTDQEKRTYLDYDKAKVGAVRNGQATPASDAAKIVSELASLVSERTRLLRSLEKVLNQNVEIASVSQDGASLTSLTAFSVDDLPPDISNKLVEEDSRDYLGHMSGARFVIKDDSIYECSFTETPPAMTLCTVNGGMPLVGEQGNLAGMPVLTAYGVDFDLWRQYGFKGEKPFDKPFFSSAEYQCAPYAVMLLSRQRRDIITGNITLMGNEFYQLGDVVYVAHRQMLYYVTKVSHNFSYSSGEFRTSLELKYGHPPGQYIPTPLDIIGKMQITTGNSQGAYRIRRENPRLDSLIGTVVFAKDSSNIFEGKHAKRNYEQLVNALTMSQTEVDKTKSKTSTRVYCLSFFGGKSIQSSRCDSVKKWLSNPTKPAAAGGGIGPNGFGGSLSGSISKLGGGNSIGTYRVDPDLVKTQIVEQESPTDADQQLLLQGIVASQETYTLDPENFGVVEIRLRHPPVGGWTDE